MTVYYDANEPAIAILEPEVYSPFFTPLLLGVMFFFGGSFTLWRTFRQVVDGQPAPQQGATTRRRIVATATMSVLIYVVVVLVLFDSAVRETFVKAFGERTAGISNSLLVHALQTLLYLPIPWVFWHGMQLMFQAMEDGRRIGIGYLFAVCGFHPHLRRSQIVCIGGLVYFVVMCGAWVACAAARGI